MTDATPPTVAAPDTERPVAEVATRKPIRPLDWAKVVGLGIVFFVLFAILGSLFRLPNTVTSIVGLFLATWLAGRIVGWYGTARWVLAAVLIFVLTGVLSFGLLLAFASDVDRVLAS